jgi:hypothetical protein
VVARKLAGTATVAEREGSDDGLRREIAEAQSPTTDRPQQGGNMTRKLAIYITAAAVIALVAVPAAAGKGKSRTKTITIQATSELENIQLVDNPPSGNSAGDVLVFTESLFDLEGRLIGSDAATCTRLFDQRSLCTGTYSLPRGEVMVQLLQPGLGATLTYTQAITGGTGRFARASGTVTVDQQPTGDSFRFRIVVPRRGGGGK